MIWHLHKFKSLEFHDFTDLQWADTQIFGFSRFARIWHEQKLKCLDCHDFKSWHGQRPKSVDFQDFKNLL